MNLPNWVRNVSDARRRGRWTVAMALQRHRSHKNSCLSSLLFSFSCAARLLTRSFESQVCVSRPDLDFIIWKTFRRYLSLCHRESRCEKNTKCKLFSFKLKKLFYFIFRKEMFTSNVLENRKRRCHNTKGSMDSKLMYFLEKRNLLSVSESDCLVERELISDGLSNESCWTYGLRVVVARHWGQVLVGWLNLDDRGWRRRWWGWGRQFASRIVSSIVATELTWMGNVLESYSWEFRLNLTWSSVITAVWVVGSIDTTELASSAVRALQRTKI